MVENIIQSMPKIELHCHLDGSIPPTTIQTLATQQNISLPHDEEEFRSLISVDHDCQSLVEYLDKFNLVIHTLQTADALHLAALQFIKSLSQENVVYVEVRFAPLLHTNTLSCDEVVKNVLAGLKEGEQKYGVQSNAILCAMRHECLETNTPLIATAKKYIGYGVCALDLAGDENGYPVLLHRPFFDMARAEGIPFTIHAGECGSVDSIRNAIALGSQRIGHGIALVQDDSLRKQCKDENIGIEMCPISNIQTKAATNWNHYPFPLFLDEQLPISINTDNRTVSNTTLTREFINLVDQYNITLQDIQRIANFSISTAFLPAEQKQKLQHQFDQFFAPYVDSLNV